MSYSKLLLLVYVLFGIPLCAMESAFQLVREDKLPELQERLKDFIDIPGYRDFKGNSLLHYARSPAMAHYLLMSGVEVNNQSPTGDTPLHAILFTSVDGNFPVVEVLLEAGADSTLTNEMRQTPVHHIVAHNFEFLIKFFSKVPRYMIFNCLREQRKQIAFTLVACLTDMQKTKRHNVPKDIRRMLVQYFMMPPYKLYNERKEVTKIVEDKIEIIRTTLQIKDLDTHIPQDHQIFIWPEDKLELLDPHRPEQYGQGILDSIASQLELEYSYIYDLKSKVVQALDNMDLKASPLPSIE